VNSPPPKPEVILTNFFAEPTVLLVPITSRDPIVKLVYILGQKRSDTNLFTKINNLIFNEILGSKYIDIN